MAYIHTEQTHTYIYKEKRFSSVYYEWGYIIVQMTSQTCVQKFNLNIQSICTCITSQSETHDSQDAEWRNVPWCINNYVYRTNKKKITSHEIVICCTGFSMEKKKILTTRTNEECTCFDVWLKKRFFPFSQFDTFSEWHQIITTCPCMVFIFLSSSNTRKKAAARHVQREILHTVVSLRITGPKSAYYTYVQKAYNPKPNLSPLPLPPTTL